MIRIPHRTALALLLAAALAPAAAAASTAPSAARRSTRSPTWPSWCEPPGSSGRGLRSRRARARPAPGALDEGG